jgi:hypothetical protein
MKLELLTNATVVDDVIRFVEQKTKDKEMIASSCYSNEGDKRLWKFRYKLQHEEPGVKVVNRSGSDGDDGDDTLLLTWNKKEQIKSKVLTIMVFILSHILQRSGQLS